MKHALILVKEFHDACGVIDRFHSDLPRDEQVIPQEDWRLRIRLVSEEVNETINALQEGNKILAADGCADSLYVVAGTALQIGIPVDEHLRYDAIEMLQEDLKYFRTSCESGSRNSVRRALNRLQITLHGLADIYNLELFNCIEEAHSSNMTKVVDGKVIRDAGGKILKPDTYTKADFASVVGMGPLSIDQ